LRRETASIRRAAGTADAREGVIAFLAKRPPRFGSEQSP
jgi:enoyl-CoA hydratase/carnithine racemase